MKTVLLNVFEEKVEIVDIEPTLEEYYRLLQCDLIDIVPRKIGGEWFDVMCDDEGTFKEPQKISAINDMGEPMFVGNLMFFKNDGQGNLLGLDDEEIQHIQKHIQHMFTKKYWAGYPMLTQCEYR